ncbi:MAG: hypothetical protein BWY98_00991 [Tenericutes bacterium ADurb.BinA155]|jgi:hypothetical protein|nr:MAG: hypothetical protein BWY98_00991 [Tenericutes bacterium ADurb.BinA155]
MKKQFVILPAMLLVSTLAACGNSLSKDQAVAAAKKIQAYHTASSFAYKDDKVTFTSSVAAPGTADIAMEIRYSKGAYVYNKTSMSLNLTGTATSASAITTTEYAYSQNGKYYYVADMMGNVTSTALTKDQFDSVFTGTASGMGGYEGLGTSSLKTVVSGAETVYTMLDTFIASNDSSSSSKANTSVATSSVETSSVLLPSFTSEEGTSESYVYTSTGDGNLTLTQNLAESNSSIHASAQNVVSFNDYYPEYVTGYTKGTYISASTEATEGGTLDMRFKWGTCTEIYPTIPASSATSAASK